MTQADQTYKSPGNTIARGVIDMFVDAPEIRSGASGKAGQHPRRPGSRRGSRDQAIAQMIAGTLAEKGSAELLALDETAAGWLLDNDIVRSSGDRVRITLVGAEPRSGEGAMPLDCVEADAGDPRLLAGRYFDIVLCGSVIEQVGDWARMQAVADNIRRLAPRYCVETPNFWFPYEPHFQVPGFQFLPLRIRTALMMRLALGAFPRMTSWNEARIHVEQHRLLAAGELRRLFPDAVIRRQRQFGLARTLLAMRG